MGIIVTNDERELTTAKNYTKADELVIKYMIIMGIVENYNGH